MSFLLNKSHLQAHNIHATVPNYDLLTSLRLLFCRQGSTVEGMIFPWSFVVYSWLWLASLTVQSYSEYQKSFLLGILSEISRIEMVVLQRTDVRHN